MRVFKALLAVALLAGSLSANAVPAVWEDYKNFDPDVLVQSGGHFDYYHDITDNGFTPFVDLITNFQLSVNLFDDGDRQLEVALVDVPGAVGDQLFFNVNGSEFGGWSLVGYLELLLTGRYDVRITSITGDFYVGDSTLTAWGDDNSTSVPEPATLSMLGLGLLGLGAVARRRRRV